ncbi:TIGR02300 family protein [Consotaella salsifontis]|uniref:TIGR02300 family protein n=1 Tax=Consotaella salsifontis TaxID=1365950 RepID=A0A1T4QY81_9HYPH|nr:TIGR02300 family protein [Consotaella salsifontis]SKA08308.1 TIGR02300 family protein [Consotaella salsifontis]
MAKPELGTKRICPETGRKFYDLNKDPIVSPYTGVAYPRSYFESESTRPEAEEEEAEVDVVEAAESPTTVPLSDVEEEEEAGADDDLPDLGDDEEDSSEAEDDTFLEEDEEDDDMTGFIGGGRNDDEE